MRPKNTWIGKIKKELSKTNNVRRNIGVCGWGMKLQKIARGFCVGCVCPRVISSICIVCLWICVLFVCHIRVRCFLYVVSLQWRADTCECPGLTRTKLLDWMPLPRPKSSFITNLLIGWPPPYRDPADAQDDRPLSLPIYAPLSIRRLYVVRISSVCLYVFCMLSVYRLYVVCMSSVCLLYVFCMSSVCQLYVVCMSSVCRLYVACMSSVCRLYVLCMSSLSSVCLLYVVCMFMYGVFMSFGCRQYAVCMSSVCFM